MLEQPDSFWLNIWNYNYGGFGGYNKEREKYGASALTLYITPGYKDWYLGAPDGFWVNNQSIYYARIGGTINDELRCGSFSVALTIRWYDVDWGRGANCPY